MESIGFSLMYAHIIKDLACQKKLGPIYMIREELGHIYIYIDLTRQTSI